MTMRAAVIGNPIAHSKSPRLHNFWLKALGIDGAYEAREAPIDGFAGTIQGLINAGFRGCNVTIPFKEEAFHLADESSEMAKMVGAANTLIFNEGKIFADNTDGYGFGENIRAAYPDWELAGKHVVLGAGGAARAIVGWLVLQGAREIVIVNRSLERAGELKKLGKQIRVATWDEAALAIEGARTLINTTSLGMKGENDIKFDFSHAASSLIVNDIVYTPLETGFLRDARAVGLPTVDGLGMLLWQARPGFRAWFGQEPPAIDQQLREMMLAP